MGAAELWYMTPRDTVYFGGGMPFNAGEGGYLHSIFPPSPRIMQGFVRTAILAAHGVDWDSYYKDYCNICGKPASLCEVLATVGSAGCYDDMKLDLRGPVIAEDIGGGPSTLLFPAPRDLVCKGEKLVRLAPGGKEIVCDLGSVRLPRILDEDVTERSSGSQRASEGTTEHERIEDLADYWITEEGFIEYLKGGEVHRKDLRHAGNIFGNENRTGIGRNNATGAVKTGLLYSLGHVRLKKGYKFAEWVSGVPPQTQPSRIQILGGEKRLSYLDRAAAAGWNANLGDPGLKQHIARKIDAAGGRFKLVFLQPGLLDLDGAILPVTGGTLGIVKLRSPFGHSSVVFSGLPKDLGAILVSACQPRPQRIGGWNMAAREGRGESIPMEHVIPAGSVFFFEARAVGEEIVEALHGVKLGRETRIGFGEVMVGAW
ncbi:MAG: hypothetical protein HPY52_14995 [Firmicutes bacterium]|nr:hypothetical protein [Bacillota bacterium]